MVVGYAAVISVKNTLRDGQTARAQLEGSNDERNCMVLQEQYTWEIRVFMTESDAVLKKELMN